MIFLCMVAYFRPLLSDNYVIVWTSRRLSNLFCWPVTFQMHDSLGFLIHNWWLRTLLIIHMKYFDSRSLLYYYVWRHTHFCTLFSDNYMYIVLSDLHVYLSLINLSENKSWKHVHIIIWQVMTEYAAITLLLKKIMCV